jgi:spermidine synthase
MASGILRLTGGPPGRPLALLYFFNSIGAVVGVLASGFVLISNMGLPGTICFAGFINLGISCAVFFIFKKPYADISHDNADLRLAATQVFSIDNRLLIASALITGAASFIYEIGWIRMLSMVLSTTTQSLELMLSAFILGLAAGGLWLHRHIDQILNPVRYLARIQIAMGLCALSTLFLYAKTFDVMQWVVLNLPKTISGFAIFNLISGSIAVAIMLPTTFFAGMTLPLITSMLIRNKFGEKSIGGVYAANTLGSILGVFTAVHLLMPLLGLKGTIASGAVFDIALGILLILKTEPMPHLRIANIVAVLVIGVTGVVAGKFYMPSDLYKMASGVYRNGMLLEKNDGELLYHRDGKTATVSCLLEKSGHMTIKTNGKTDASMMMTAGSPATVDEHTNIMLGVIPMLLHPNARTVAVIGLGSGLTTHALLGNPRYKQVETIEIEKGMIKAANNFRPRVERAYTDPRSMIINNDARTYLSSYKKTFDVIMSEPSAVWVSGASGLFSEEFYRSIKQHMNENGVFVQWIHLNEIDVNLVVSVLKAISANFSDYEIFMPTDFEMIIAARKDGQIPAHDFSILNEPAIAEMLQRINIKTAQDFSFRIIGNKNSFEKLLGTFDIGINSDYNQIIDQRVAATRYLLSSAADFSTFTASPLPLKEFLGFLPARQTITNTSYSPFSTTMSGSYVAMKLRDFFYREGFDPTEIPEKTRSHAIQLKSDYSGKTGRSEDERLVTLFNVAIAMVPYLSSAELEPLWNLIESGEHAKQASPRENQWRNLFKSIGRRDALEMYKNSLSLLQVEQGIVSQAQKFLLAAGMTGALAQGDKNASYRLWQEFNIRTFRGNEPDLLFRLLLAEST